MTRVFRYFALTLFGILAVTPGMAAEPEKKQVTIGVGSTILNYMPLALGQSLGFFKQEGLDVRIENFLAGGSKALQALVGGSIDGAVGFYDHTIQMQAKGKEIMSVFMINELPGFVFGVRADLADKVKSGADLKGLRIGITAPGSSTDMIVRYYVKKSGLNVRDVNIIAVGSGAPGMVALEAKNIDALGYYDPIATILEQKKAVKVLFDGRTEQGSKEAFGGVYPTACLYLNKDFIDRNPETVQRLVNALLRTMRWIAANTPEKVAEAIPAGYRPEDKELTASIMKASTGLFSKTGLVSPDTLKTPLAVLATFDENIGKANVDLTRTFTNRFAEEAARRLK